LLGGKVVFFVELLDLLVEEGQVFGDGVDVGLAVGLESEGSVGVGFRGGGVFRDNNVT